MSELGISLDGFTSRTEMRQNNALPLLVCLCCGLQGRQVGTDLFPSAQSSQQDGFFKVAQWCMYYLHPLDKKCVFTMKHSFLLPR
jgi:hypothetical protein